jgi:hypothetical protein
VKRFCNLEGVEGFMCKIRGRRGNLEFLFKNQGLGWKFP